MSDNETISRTTKEQLERLQAASGFWYVATPYTKYPAGLEAAFSEACRCSAWLIKNQVRIFCPIAHTHPIAKHGVMELTDLNIWIPADKPLMDAAAGLIVIMMEAWVQSVGIRFEIAEFEKQNKPVEYMRWPRQ